MRLKRYETFADFEREELGRVKRFYECMEEIMDQEMFGSYDDENKLNRETTQMELEF